VDFTESPEHQMLREAVAGIGRQFGHEYYAERARSGGNVDELWDAVAAQGFFAVHLPEEWGGGGGGISELAIVCEELGAQGCPLLLMLVSPGISAEVIAQFGDDEQRGTWLPGLVAGEKVVFAISLHSSIHWSSRFWLTSNDVKPCARTCSMAAANQLIWNS